MLVLIKTAIVCFGLLTAQPAQPAQPITGTLIPVEIFEDGSWVATVDGVKQTGCFTGNICER